MSLELLNTSSPQGVHPGAAGFCTVGITEGMSPALEERLTLLSGYRWLFPPGERGAERNPVAWTHWRLNFGGKTLSVLSRVCDAGIDYSRRSNRFAHHVVIDPSEQAEAGPAWVMMQPGVMRATWTGEPMVFGEGPDIPLAVSSPRICQAWANAAGDAGWAGALAGAFAADPAGVSYIIYPPGLDALPLIDEALSLLPAASRWQVTFSTYFTDLPAGMSCAWRFCAAGSRAAEDAARLANTGIVIDLTRPLAAAPDGPHARAARSGTGVEPEWATARGGFKPSDFYATRVSDGSELYAISGTQDDPQAATRLAAGMARAAAAAETEPATPGFEPPNGAALEARRAAMALESPLAIAPQPGEANPPVQWQESANSSAPIAPSGVRYPRGPHPAFWVIALLWPIVVGGVGWFYFDRIEHRDDSAKSGSETDTAQRSPAASQPARRPGASAEAIPIALHQETVQRLADARNRLDSQDQTIGQLRRDMLALKDTLDSAQTQAKSAATLTAEMKKLQARDADLEARLVQAGQAAAAERTVDPFHGELELWSGDGAGPPDALVLEGYKPPESILIEQSPGHIVLKAPRPAPTAQGNALPMEVAIIRIDGNRVVLDWVGANRALLSPGARAWLAFSRLLIERKENVIGSARFVPPHSATLDVNNEAPVSLVPEVRWKEALEHVALAPPAAMPAGWSAAPKNDQTLSLVSTRIAAATFDVQLVITPTGQVQPQTTYSAAVYKLIEAGEDASAAIEQKKAPVERDRQTIQDLSDINGLVAKDPARQKDLDAARADLAVQSAAQGNAQAAKKAADAALAELRAFPPVVLRVMNRENRLVLCVLTIDRGKGK